MNQKRIVVALDGLSLRRAGELAIVLGHRAYALKIHDLYDREGPVSVRHLKEQSAGSAVWMDFKLKDIPNTVALRAKAIKDAGADILTVHASGEVEMMKAAVANGPPQIYAVTVLTSLNEEHAHLLHGQPAKAAVLYQARLAKFAGVHGIVCSPKEVAILKATKELEGLKLIVAGVRSAGKEVGDQKRTDTPGGAIRAGADLIVVGRQITEGSDPPVAAFDEIEMEIQQALEQGEKKS